MAGFDHQLAHGVKVHRVMQEVLEVQFLVNKQLARFEVNEFLDQKFIFCKAAAAAVIAAAAAEWPFTQESWQCDATLRFCSQQLEKIP